MIGLQIIGKIWVNVPIQYFEIYNQYGYNFLYSNSWFVLPRPVNTTALVLNWKWLPLFQFLICSETHTLVVQLEMIRFWISGKIWANVPIQYFEIYNQCGYNFLYSNSKSWFVLPRPAMSTTALVLNWKWLPLFQFLICSETHTLVLNWKWLGFESLGKFEWMYPFNILKFTIRKFESMYPFNILEFTIRKFEWMYPFNILKFTISVRVQFPLFQFLICSETHPKLEMIGLQFIGKIWANVPIPYFEIYNQKIWVVPIQYFEIYNQWVQFPVFHSWFVLPRPATALVLNWKWLPLFQFLICSETHTLVLNWKWLGFESLGKFEWMYPLNTLKFTIRKFEWMYPFNILKFTISTGTISSIPIPDL